MKRVALIAVNLSFRMFGDNEQGGDVGDEAGDESGERGQEHIEQAEEYRIHTGVFAESA